MINAEVMGTSFASGKYLQRVSIITPYYSSIILEIWSSSKEMEPKFAKSWKNLQFIFCRNVVYHGICEIKPGTTSHVFRLSQKYPENRYIWLSHDSPDFWSDPVWFPDPCFDQQKEEVRKCWLNILKFNVYLRILI